MSAVRTVSVLVAAAALSAQLVAHDDRVSGSSRTTKSESHQVCARQFDRAVRAYVTTTDRRDAPGFNALLHPDVTIIFANGGVLSGKPDSAAFIDDFFADPGWTQTFTELRRRVEGCRTGFVLFDSVYSVPAEDRASPLVIGVTFTYAHGRWLVLHNQDSTGPASS
jgi:hypothetical protein